MDIYKLKKECELTKFKIKERLLESLANNNSETQESLFSKKEEIEFLLKRL